MNAAKRFNQFAQEILPRVQMVSYNEIPLPLGVPQPGMLPRVAHKETGNSLSSY